MTKINARTKGIVYEQRIRKELIELGWARCQTARYASKMVDDQLVDFVNTKPFNIQAKALERAPAYHDILDNMPKDGNTNVIFHKRNNRGTVVTMSKENFYKLIRDEAKKAQSKDQS